MSAIILPILLLTPALAIAVSLPVTQCGQVLDVKGGSYVLAGDLSCSQNPALTISANRIRLDTAKFNVTTIGNALAISDGVSDVTIDGGGSLSGGGGVTIGQDRNITITNVTLSGEGDLGGSSGGVAITGATNVKISKCTISGVFAINGTVNRSVFSDNGVTATSLGATGGILLDGDHNSVADNTLTESNAGAATGNVGISVSHNNRVSDNTVNGFYIGIEFTGDSNVVTGNTVTGTGPSVPDPSNDGILAESGAKHNRITKNTAGGNIADLYDSNGPPCVNTWRNNTFSTSGGATACIR
jgi:parallel beta-helix repeat protein